jgi:hypothetical protein
MLTAPHPPHPFTPLAGVLVLVLAVAPVLVLSTVPTLVLI